MARSRTISAIVTALALGAAFSLSTGLTANAVPAPSTVHHVPGPRGPHFVTPHFPTPNTHHIPAVSPAPTVAVGSNPVDVVDDPAVHTAYVGNQVDDTISLFNTATCNAITITGCTALPVTISVGSDPIDGALDIATNTIYFVANNSDTVSVINAATCNVSVQTGCSAPAQMVVGDGPQGIGIDQATNTIYVTNLGLDPNAAGTVSVVDGATCNGSNTTACGASSPTVTVGVGPAVPSVDEATNTLYVPNTSPDGTGSISVVNGKTCNSTITSGCGNTPATLGAGPGSYDVEVDQGTNTVYELVPGASLGTVKVFNGATCNSTVTSGCHQSAPSVGVGSGDYDAVIDPATEELYVENEEDNDVSVIDARICNAQNTHGCNQVAPSIAAGFNPGYIDVDVATDTIYTANQGDNTVSVLNGASCTLTHQAGCRHPVPTTTVGNGAGGIAVDQLTNTIYVGNADDSTLSVISGTSCNAGDLRDCGSTWPTIVTGPSPLAVAVDPLTDTIYTANIDQGFGNTVSVINGSTCNSHVRSGCGQTATTVTVGSGALTLAVDVATNTIYVVNNNDSTISVIDGKTCDSSNTSGCAATPPTIDVSATGLYPNGIGIDQATNTVLVASGTDNTVSVIDGATCDATVHTGCTQTPSTIAVGNGPEGIDVDVATDTAYVANVYSENLSVLNLRTCDATHTSGCGQVPPTMSIGGYSFRGVAVDQLTNTIYVQSVTESAVDVLDGRTCNSLVTSGCAQTPRLVSTGGWPVNEAIDEATGTVYVPSDVDGQVAIISAR